MTDTEPADAQPPRSWLRRHLRIILLVASLVVGIALIILGDYMNFGSLRFDAETGPYWSGVAVNGGTTVVLAGLLVWFERQLTSTVRQVRADATREIGEAREEFQAALEQARTDLNIRMDQLDERTIERAASAMKEEVESVERLRADPSRGSVIDAMHTAGELNAIARNNKTKTLSIIIPAGAGTDAIPLTVAYTPEIDGDWGTERATLQLGHGWGDAVEFVDWLPGMSAPDVFDGLRRLLVRADEGGLARSLSPERFFEGLLGALDQAVRRRQGNGNFWIQGSPVLEYIAPSWLITAFGVEVEGHGLVIGRNSFGHWDWDEGHVTGWVNGKTVERPADLDEATWDQAYGRAYAHFEEDEFDF